MRLHPAVRNPRQDVVQFCERIEDAIRASGVSVVEFWKRSEDYNDFLTSLRAPLSGAGWSGHCMAAAYHWEWRYALPFYVWYKTTDYGYRRMTVKDAVNEYLDFLKEEGRQVPKKVVWQGYLLGDEVPDDMEPAPPEPNRLEFLLGV
jgi:hypothetical protein